MARLKEVELKEFGADSLTGSFQNFGSTLSNPGIEITISNDSAVDAYISKDGDTNWMRVRANSAISLGFTRTGQDGSEEYLLSKGTQLEIKQVTGAGAAGTAIVAHVVTRAL